MYLANINEDFSDEHGRGCLGIFFALLLIAITWIGKATA